MNIHIKTKLFVSVVALFWGLAVSASTQTFTLASSQIEIAVAPSFNHCPVKVAFTTNVAGLNLANLSVVSDSAWVTPTVDAATLKIGLSFATSNLVNSVYTATITASLAGTTKSFFVKAYVSQLNIFKLKDDSLRSRTYGIQQNGLALGSLVVLDPVTGTCIGNVTVGKKPSDLAESADGKELFVINCVDETVSVIDLNSLSVKETITLPAFDNWGQSDTTANIAVGPANILYYTDGAWAPALRVLDRSTKQVLQTVGIDGNGFGDIGVSSDNSQLFAWAQYGWSAGWGGSYIAKFAVAPDGLLTFTQETATQYPTVLGRDPLETPVLISGDASTVFIKQLAVSADNVTDVKYSFPSPVYSISPGGEIAVTDSAIYETQTGIKLADLPKTASVQTISSDYSRLIYFDSSSYTLKELNLLDLIGPGILNRDIIPADGSIVLSPERLEWSPLPGVDRYNVYLGQSESAIASATTNSPLFLGTVSQPLFQIPTALTPGITYFWRVDAFTEFDATKGDVRAFTVSMISCTPNLVDVSTVQGHRNFKTALNLNSVIPGMEWKASADQSWVSFTKTNGAAPASLELVLDASELSAGLHQANVTISSGTNALFSIPVRLLVDALNLTVMKSTPGSVFSYAISEDTSTTPARAYLLEINTATESIERVTRVGASATDLAIHTGDNRAYVPNWLTGSLLAIDLGTFTQVRAYAFSPFGGMGYSQGDIYRVSAGGPGRLVWEEEDQWIDINIFDTVAGTNLASAFVREGGGTCSPNNRYYYHGDDNISDASIYKYDMIGDRFTELASTRVSSVNYYGSRTVVVSEDGSHVFWNGSSFDANLIEQWSIGDEIFATSASGQYAFSQTKIYDTVQKTAVLSMPATTAVSTFNSASQKLIVQVGGSLRFFTITSPLSLPAPVLSAGSIAYNLVGLSWTDRSLESSFTLQQRLSGATNWTDIAAPSANQTLYTVAGLAPQTTYEFRIKADSASISSPWSSVMTITTLANPPTTPVLNVPVATVGNVALSWSNPTYEDAIILERSVGTSTNWLILATFPPDTTGCNDTSVTSLANYFYRVKATNNAGESAYSVIRSVQVPAPQPPAAPAGLVAKPLSSSTVLLTWNDVSAETGYRLERRTENTNSWTVVAVLPANTTFLTNLDLVQGVQYWYRVQAFNANGNSPYSNEADAVPLNIVNLIADNFDSGLNPGVWARISGGMATNGGQGFRASKALYFAAGGERSATTIPVNVSMGGNIEFLLRAGNEAVDGNALWNNSESGENVVLEYSGDNSATWTTLQALNTVYPAMSGWTNISITIPAGAYGTNTQFRWRQLANSGPAFDCWALEDLVIQGVAPLPPEPVPFVISSSSSSSSISIFWVGVADAFSYVVERKMGSQLWTPIATLPMFETYYSDSGLLPGTLYSYRIQAVNAGGFAAYSPLTITRTWTQKEQWAYDNYGSQEAMNAPDKVGPCADGSAPLLRYAFNLTADEPMHCFKQGQTNGYPAIRFDESRNRLCVEFVRRKASMNPGVIYQVEFSGNLTDWTTNSVLISTTPIDSLLERVSYEDLLTRDQANVRFSRVTVHP